MRTPPVTWLQAFDAAARHMSFTEAARELAVTQSAVSQHIRALEAQIGQALFVRRARSVELTEAGRAYAPVVQDAFARLLTGTEELFGLEREAPLTIRTTPGFATFWLAPRLARFRDRQPDVPLRLATGIWSTDFTGEGVDLEVAYGSGAWEGREGVRLTRERLLPLASPALAERLTTPADLAGVTLLHAVGFDTGWPQWLRAAAAEPVAERAPAVYCDTAVTALECARQSVGVALARSSFAAAARAGGGLVAPFDLSVETAEAFHLLWPRGRVLRPEAEAFRDWIVAEAEAAPQA